MKNFQKTVLASSLLLVSVSAVAADKLPVSGNVALTTNYVWRGVSQSAENPALQGGFDYEHDKGFYLGTWASGLNWGNDAVTSADGDGASIEVDLYGGYKFKAGPIDMDVGFIHYMYPGANSSLDYDFTELYVGGGYGPFSLKYSHASDYQGTTSKSGTYLDAAVSLELPEGFGLGLHVGKSGGDGVQAAFGKKYTDYKVSVSKDIGGFGFELAYTDTNLSGASQIKKGVFANDGQFMLTVSKSL
ncbi:MAG TPA: TorF family putative porin [Sulfuricaulis sp.]|nr:TorF family putative porin [Sulfuricaulis sp.]